MSGPMVLNAAKLLCDMFYLAFVVWREARGASREAKIAVAWSLMDRVEHPGWWGTDISSVATKREQYSSLTHPGDPQLARAWPLLNDASWLECLGVAYDVIHGDAPKQFPTADSYFDSSMPKPPYWADEKYFCGEIKSPHGNTLRFYNLDHDYERSVTGDA